MPAAIAETWDEKRLQRERLEKLQSEMKRRDIAALYLDDTINIRYVLNLRVPGGAVFIPPQGEAIAFVRPRDMGYVSLRYGNLRPPLFEYHAGSDEEEEEGSATLADSIRQLMADYGVAGERLGVDKLGRPGAFIALIKGGIHLVDGMLTINTARSVKTQDEIEVYRVIGQQYAHSVKAFRDAIRPGVTENELASVVGTAWYEAGGEDVAQLNVCAGENMNPWRRWPTQRALQEGEFVGIDLHGRGPCGLRGDSSRTFFVGERPTTEQRDLYRQAYGYLLGSADAFRAGRSVAEVLAEVPPVPEKYRVQQENYHVGHDIGMTPQGIKVNKHRIERGGRLNANQVIAIECYFGEVGGRQAVKLEEMIVVRDGPPERLGLSIPVDERLAA